uniref:Uncharacterized protein n=1 Tax=Emiliania huxleyi (strain CCMP1516) TaxID=280463 RepID=A0A0D3JKG7_EMIH1
MSSSPLWLAAAALAACPALELAWLLLAHGLTVKGLLALLHETPTALQRGGSLPDLSLLPPVAVSLLCLLSGGLLLLFKVTVVPIDEPPPSRLTAAFLLLSRLLLLLSLAASAASSFVPALPIAVLALILSSFRETSRGGGGGGGGGGGEGGEAPLFLLFLPLAAATFLAQTAWLLWRGPPLDTSTQRRRRCSCCSAPPPSARLCRALLFRGLLAQDLSDGETAAALSPEQVQRAREAAAALHLLLTAASTLLLPPLVCLGAVHHARLRRLSDESPSGLVAS